MSGSVLVLDDDELLLEVMTDVLDGLCHRGVVKAKSFAELEQQEQEALSSEIAILDINLGVPDAPNGMDAFSWLQSKGYSGRVFFFTAHASSHPLVTEALKLGQVQVLSKPLDVETLLQAIGG